MYIVTDVNIILSVHAEKESAVGNFKTAEVR